MLTTIMPNEENAIQRKLLVLMLDDFVSGHDGRGNYLDGITHSPSFHATDHADAAARDFVHRFTQLFKRARLARCDTSRAHAQSLMLACEQSFVVACALGHLKIQPQALAWLEAGAREGRHLALGSRLSQRMVSALMDHMLGQHWAHRFFVVATGDPASINDEQEDLHDAILRQAVVSAHEALLVTASERCQGIACRMGMQTVLLNGQATPTSPFFAGMDVEATM